MGLTCTVGGARGTFDTPLADEVAGLLDQAFGAEGDWEGTAPRHFGELTDDDWDRLRDRAVSELGPEALPNLLALGDRGCTVYLPAHVQAMTMPLSAGVPLRCASLPGLREELADLAARWDLALDDRALLDILQVSSDPDDGLVADAPEILAFARLALASNEAVRRDSPLWLFV